MPITLKPDAMRYRDPEDGTYKGIDVIAERATSEQVADIDAAGAAELLAIQNASDAAQSILPDGQTLNNLAANSAPQYDATAAYAVGDYVVHDYRLYRCKRAIAEGGEAWTAAHWDACSTASEVTNVKQDLTNDLKYIVGNEIVPITIGHYIVTSGSTYDISDIHDNASFGYAICNVTPGEIFTIKGTGSNSPRLFAFGDSNGNILVKASEFQVKNYEPITAPANSSILIVNVRTDYEYALFKGNALKNRVANLETRDTQLKQEIDNNNGIFNGYKKVINDYISDASRTTEDVSLSWSNAEGFYDIKGNFSAYSGIKSFEISNLTPGDAYLLTANAYYNMAIFLLYDSSNNVIEGYKGTAMETHSNIVIVVPANARKVLLQKYSNQPVSMSHILSFDYPEITSILNGKKITVIGDSITEHNWRAKTNWPMWIADWCGATIQNLGVGGTGFANGSNKYVDRIGQISSDADIIGVAMSFNDFSSGLPLGTKSDTGTSTIAGHVNDFFSTLITAFPTTPIICYCQSPWEYYSPRTANGENLVTLIKDICAYHGVPFYDKLFYGSALKPWIADNRTAYYTSDNPDVSHPDPVTDNTHPNSEGHKVIARYLYPQFVENIVDTGLNYN